MRLRHFAASAFVALSLAPTNAQEYYDLTEHYLTNSLFDSQFDYDVNQTGNVAQEMLPVKGWTNDYDVDYTIVGTYQVGTKKTYNNAAIPAANAEGTTDGGVLALSTGWGVELKLFQGVYLPAGKYKIVSAYYNGDAAQTAGTSLTGWIPQSGTKAMSTVSSFVKGQWIKDEISFTLTKATMGKVQVGFKAVPNVGSASAAKISVDYVKLLRDTPYGEADEELLSNPAGPVPTVTTDSRFARGATMAFGRMTVADGGAVIKEQGFCYGESPEPTVADNRCTTTMVHNGTMYWLKDLKPATMYYMRAYAITAGNQVGYGDIIKFSTVPKGNVTYWYNNGGSEAENKRINDALTEACDIFSSLTSIQKHFAVGYGSGTPTADCNYKDEPWMNVGPNQSYQRTGTIMHEMQHGLGVISYSTQWSKGNLRSSNGTGQWLGDRVSAFLDFWDNTTGSRLNGDTQHMWPYGINGAQEDNGTLQLYYANAMIGQALGEDGLEHKSTTFADPYYSFNQEDDVKYYIKNEGENRGRYTSFLMPNKSGTLKWASMTAAEAARNDSTAWYITFTPANQYYQLRNAATGEYLTYNSGIKTATKSSLSANENWHLMRGRVDVEGMRGYWIIHPTNNWTPPCLQANSSGTTTAATFNIANSAETQRWLILTADELTAIENKAMEHWKKETENILKHVKTLPSVAHLEDVKGADETLQTAITDIESRMAEATTVDELKVLPGEAKAAAMTFLRSVTPTTGDNPFDLTWLMVNPTVDESIDGWTTSVDITDLKYGCVEYYQKTFDFSQTITGLPAGFYDFRTQAFQRPGWPDACSGTAVTTSVYAGSASKPVSHAVNRNQASSLGGSESQVDGYYIPNDMEAASIYFNKGHYKEHVESRVESDGGSLKVGLRCTAAESGYWTIFTGFNLYYYGNIVTGDVNRDGEVGGADVSCIVNYLLGLTPDVFSQRAADVNGDGFVTLLDVTALIEKIRTKQ